MTEQSEQQPGAAETPFNPGKSQPMEVDGSGKLTALEAGVQGGKWARIDKVFAEACSRHTCREQGSRWRGSRDGSLATPRQEPGTHRMLPHAVTLPKVRKSDHSVTVGSNRASQRAGTDLRVCRAYGFRPDSAQGRASRVVELRKSGYGYVVDRFERLSDSA